MGSPPSPLSSAARQHHSCSTARECRKGVLRPPGAAATAAGSRLWASSGPGLTTDLHHQSSPADRAGHLRTTPSIAPFIKRAPGAPIRRERWPQIPGVRTTLRQQRLSPRGQRAPAPPPDRGWAPCSQSSVYPPITTSPLGALHLPPPVYSTGWRGVCMCELRS